MTVHAEHPIRTVRKLVSVSERLPDKIRREILALGDAAVSPMLEFSPTTSSR